MGTLGVVVPSAVRVAEKKLIAHGINPGPLGMLALTAIDANNRGTGMRDVAAMAAKLPDETEAIQKDAMAGKTAPLGYFDPVGFSTNIAGETLAFFREAELKHGRVAMFATLGIIAGEKFSPVFGAKDVPPAAMLFGQATPAGAATFWGGAF